MKAVYPQKTKEDLASSTIEQLLNESTVKNVLGTVRKIEMPRPEILYKELQSYVDSKEKASSLLFL
jgi:hypothetical protein